MKTIKKYKQNQSNNQKKLFILLFMLFIVLPLEAIEIPVGLMVGIADNSEIIIKYKNMTVSCRPFGIKPLENIQRESASQDVCAKEIAQLYRKHPSAKTYAKQVLHLNQSYHFEKQDDKCFLYANGAETYSEMLLSEGLAVIDEKFDDKEWNDRLKRAYSRGRLEKKGMHDNTDVIGQCIEKKK